MKSEWWENESDKKKELREYYYKNNMRELKKICDSVILWSIPQMYYDDLYDDAMIVLEESLYSYDKKKSSFDTYLTGNIRRSFYDWIRAAKRYKRCNVQVDNNGKIVKDENGDPIIIQNISLDASLEDNIDLHEKIKSNFNIEEELDIYETISLEMKKYLGKLSNLQLEILKLIDGGYSQREIEDMLCIDSSVYKDNLAAIRSYKNTRCIESLFRR